jgi:pyruvate carboxylase
MHRILLQAVADLAENPWERGAKLQKNMKKKIKFQIILQQQASLCNIFRNLYN